MKSRNEMRKPEKDFYSGADELKKSRKLKPVKKDKNPKKAFFDEIEDLDEIEMDDIDNGLDDEENFDEEDDDF